MKMKSFLFFLVLVFAAPIINAQQKVIQLYNGAAPGSENWTWSEQENDHNAWNTKVVFNVSHPTLDVFLPDSSVANSGTAVVICPGGGFYALSINSEGYDVAKWLTQRGVTCFVLKYRLVHVTSDDPAKEWMDGLGKQEETEKMNADIPLAVADGKAAIAYVRAHASDYGISSDKIGIIGFSAGGTVAASAAYNYTPENRPDFDAPIYAYMPPSLQKEIPADAPPLFLAAATDDGLGLNAHSVDLYNKWTAAKHSAELHLYAKGDHGFGMKKQDLPTDAWIDRFGDWLQQQGFTKNTATPHSEQIGYMKNMLNDWANIGRYAEANKKLSPASAKEKRVVFMGNSITDAWINFNPGYFKNNPYIDRGISGQTTPQMLVRFSEDVVNLKPAVVVILAGTNDIAGNTGPETLEEIFENIVAMAQLAKANSIRVVISSVLPVYEYPWRPGIQPAEKIATLNKMLKTYAAGHNIVYLNYYDSLVDDKKGMQAQYSKDGVHPTLEGYKVMEPLADKAIVEALKRK
jgi:acetyl esterase/lipase/lysophospholipase L1-like esterase